MKSPTTIPYELLDIFKENSIFLPVPLFFFFSHLLLFSLLFLSIDGFFFFGWIFINGYSLHSTKTGTYCHFVSSTKFPTLCQIYFHWCFSKTSKIPFPTLFLLKKQTRWNSLCCLMWNWKYKRVRPCQAQHKLLNYNGLLNSKQKYLNAPESRKKSPTKKKRQEGEYWILVFVYKLGCQSLGFMIPESILWLILTSILLWKNFNNLI